MGRPRPRSALAAVVDMLEIQTAALDAPESAELVGHWREMSYRKILILALKDLQGVSQRVPELRQGSLSLAKRSEVRSSCAKVANALAFFAARVAEHPAPGTESRAEGAS